MHKMQATVLLIVGISVLFMSGCSSQPNPSLYYYGDYTESYYTTKRETTPENALALQKAIEEAIEKRDNGSSGRVAPGMYANLGYIYLKAGETGKAIENFEKEKSIYPESTIFMNRMINKVQAMEGYDNDKQ